LEQRKKGGDDGKVFGSAGALKVAPTGQVKDYKMFNKRGQRVNMLGFSGHTVSVETTQLCCYNVKEGRKRGGRRSGGGEISNLATLSTFCLLASVGVCSSICMG